MKRHFQRQRKSSRLTLRSWQFVEKTTWLLSGHFFQSRQNLIKLLPDFMNLYKWPLNRRHQSLCKLCTCSAWSALTERFITKENYIISNKLRWTGSIFDRAIKNVRIYSVIENIMFPQCRISAFTLLSRQSHSRISCTRVVKKTIWLNHRVLPS